MNKQTKDNTGAKSAMISLDRLPNETDEQLWNRAVIKLNKIDLSDDERYPWQYTFNNT